MGFNVSSRVYTRVLAESPANCRNGSDSNKYMQEYQRRRQQITEIEVVEPVEAENISNSHAEYMQEYRHRCQLTAEIEVVQAEVVRAQVIQAEVVETEVVETEAAETEEENHNS
ncbi:hypothetical protein PHYBLDRAFT_62179 [Phycomyces blakesleeanus NRRL 1555(-)]|uniref:Uncharacterized protein n=1 Tax=Phycomyces blakesleeanus (strain ATCC 8743b / DSM 1359 / FGSC 10004 / NBRC 33097 / NRRL 1555) TaxID=763407 RepID=A0A167Q4C6_PHYB8|nr:hypothetical protein PHYBLDRAFT_62179 [Phycomyces blakesleeanus NRRL 1555(-)]OAD79057.1 hypothetical protein PHYBLDRAFT_62179 [Phycomyces blakesleeanus NRRL 1555(-)]|eukprot:XP_018297097.1 hypothetical protein PHYBLDRAFT_62179 [Phycomyces blakesleeanus NRRL 1555(-)]